MLHDHECSSLGKAAHELIKQIKFNDSLTNRHSALPHFSNLHNDTVVLVVEL